MRKSKAWHSYNGGLLYKVCMLIAFASDSPAAITEQLRKQQTRVISRNSSSSRGEVLPDYDTLLKPFMTVFCVLCCFCPKCSRLTSSRAPDSQELALAAPVSDLLTHKCQVRGIHLWMKPPKRWDRRWGLLLYPYLISRASRRQPIPGSTMTVFSPH